MELKIKTGYLFVLIAGSLWGLLGLVCKILIDYGLNSFDISFYRLLVGCIAILLYLLLRDINLLKISKEGFILTAIIGLASQTLPNGFYFYAIEKTTIATAVVLLYTAPIFTNIISRFVYQEKFTKAKIFSIILCLLGVFLMATGGDLNTLQFDLIGLLVGISAGFTFGLMPILNKTILDKLKLNPFTILFYSFFWGSIFLLPVARPLKVFSLNTDYKFWLLLLFLGFILSSVSYGFYLKGLSIGVEPSRATIISTVEIVVSVLVAYFVFSEYINFYNLLGIFLVMVSVITIQRK